MKIKVVQADTRPLMIFLESRNLSYGPPNQMDFQLIASLNKNILIQPYDTISIARMLNLLKCRLNFIGYEFMLGNKDDWEGEGEGSKAHCWIKIDALIKQIKNPENKDVELFCFIDSDAWIRDEPAFLAFCQEFLNSDYSIAAPRDIELSGYSLLNSGFIAVKNNPRGLHILETIFKHPEYRNHERTNWWEQSELSVYHEKNPGEVMVLPLNDFNTPCGRIVRHCWTKHLIEPLVIEETLACMIRMAVNSSNQPNYTIGQNVLLMPPS
jgi:hypothetical protein